MLLGHDASYKSAPSIPSLQDTQTGHWKATGRILGNFLWKILYKNLDLKGGGYRVRGGDPPPSGTCIPPFKIQICV